MTGYYMKQSQQYCKPVAVLPSVLQKLDGHHSSDADQYTRRGDPSHDYQKRDIAARTSTTKNTTLFLIIQRNVFLDNNLMKTFNDVSETCNVHRYNMK